MSTEPVEPTPAVNADQVTPVVLRRLLVALLASALAAWGVDTQLSGPTADILMWAVPAVLGLVGAWWGSKGAKDRVTVLPTSLSEPLGGSWRGRVRCTNWTCVKGSGGSTSPMAWLESTRTRTGSGAGSMSSRPATGR